MASDIFIGQYNDRGNDTEKQHNTLMRDIDNEIKSLNECNVSQYNFVQSTYMNDRGKEYRCYNMNKAGIMQMLNKESAIIRYKT